MGEVCEIKDSARIPNSEWSESGVPYIRASDVTNENTDGVLFISQERYEFYKNRTGAPTKDDVLFNGGGEIGKSLLITDEKPIYVQGGAVLYAQTSKSRELVGQYLKTYFETTNAKSYIDAASAGGTMRHFTLKPSQIMRILMPSVEEQEKIGEYFANLDQLITLHQRKCDETKQLKKFMLQKMFPKNGEKNPEIRFEGFTDDWEQRKLGEVSSKITKKNQDIVVDEVFTNSAEYGIISQRDFFDKDIANFENIDGYYIVEPNDFVYNPRISTTAPFGPIKRNKLERTGAMSPLYYVFRPHDIDLSYLECFFQTSCWHTFMRFNGNTGARSDRFAITDKVFDEMPISMPQDIEEQQKIGSYFSSLDNLITLHQRKCEKLKELKKYMLQNMFV